MQLNFPADPEYWRQKHRKALADRLEWAATAGELIEAAMVIRPTALAYWQELDKRPMIQSAPRVHGVYLMLTSYAAENLIKAIIIEKKSLNASAFIDGLPDELKSHDLSVLMQRAGIAISDAGNELLARLSAYTYWAGRYPSPLKAKFLPPMKVGQREVVIPSIKGYDFRMVENFLKSLYTHANIAVPSCLASVQHAEPPESWEGQVVIEKVTPWSEGSISGSFR